MTQKRSARMHISSLSDELLMEVFKRLGKHCAAGVCRAFRRIYHEHATSITLTHVYDRALDAPVARTLAACTQLRHLDAAALCETHNPWPLREPTQLQSLSLPVDYGSAADIPPSLASLELDSMCGEASSEWVSALLAHLDAAGSDCAVHVCAVEDTDLWQAWQHPRLRARDLSYTDPAARSLANLNRANLSHVRSLTICACDSITSLRGLDASQLARVTALTVLNCEALESLDGLQHPRGINLRELDLTGLDSLRCIAALATWTTTQLKQLSMMDCPALGSLELKGARLAQLTEILANECGLTSLQGPEICSAQQLQSLYLSGCTWLSRGPRFGEPVWSRLQAVECSQVPMLSLRCFERAALPELHRLSLHSCELTTLEGLQLAHLPALRILDVREDGELSTLAPLGSCCLPRLVELSFACDALTSLHGLEGGGCSALTSLSLKCSSLSSLGRLHSACQELKRLCLVECEALSSLHAVSSLLALESLYVRGSTALTDLSSLAGARLTRLKYLSLRGCEYLTSMRSLSDTELPCLQIMDFSECDLSDLAGLEGAKLPALTMLLLQTCTALISLHGLGDAHLPALKELHLTGCKALVSLQGLEGAGLSALTSLRLNRCSQLSSLQELVMAGLPKHAKVLCRGCKSLHSVPAELTSSDRGFCGLHIVVDDDGDNTDGDGNEEEVEDVDDDELSS